jgi:hypothetical protein
MRNARVLVNLTVTIAATIAFFCGSALLAQDEPDKSAEPVYEVGSGSGVTP